jgi:transposase
MMTNFAAPRPPALTCPVCGSALEERTETHRCGNCGFETPRKKQIKKMAGVVDDHHASQ